MWRKCTQMCSTSGKKLRAFATMYPVLKRLCSSSRIWDTMWLSSPPSNPVTKNKKDMMKILSNKFVLLLIWVGSFSSRMTWNDIYLFFSGWGWRRNDGGRWLKEGNIIFLVLFSLRIKMGLLKIKIKKFSRHLFYLYTDEW